MHGPIRVHPRGPRSHILPPGIHQTYFAHVTDVRGREAVKRHTDTVSVRTVRGWPVDVRRGDRTYRVRELIDVWVVQGRWWGEEEKRVFFRLRTDRGDLEVYRSGDRWVLSRVMD